MRRVATVCVAVVSAFGTIAAQQQTFRSGADAVLVDVSVMAHNQPVISLDRTDFVLTDNGVAQEIDDVGVVKLPIDVSVLVETGNEARFLGLSKTIQHDAALVQSLLQTGDRGSLVTVDSQVRFGEAPGDPSLRGERGTRLLDAVCAALMARIDPGRRHLVVAITAGIDTHSLIPPATRTRILSKSESPVYFIGGPPIPIEQSGFRPAPGMLGVSVPAGAVPYGEVVLMGDYSGPLHAIADATGGRYFELRKGDAFLDPLRQAIENFRSQYVLRYRPQGVSTAGWHPLVVKMTKAGDVEVRARKGYWRD
jgi:hypothetical protein